MNAMSDLFISAGFMPHGYCFHWSPGLLWSYVVSDGVIALSYYSIPVALWTFVRRRTDLPFSWLFLMFAVFIFACGTTHLIAILNIWQPDYWLDAAAKTLTAIVSFATAVLVWPLIPRALALPSPRQLDQANGELLREVAARHAVERQLQDLNQTLEQRVAERTSAMEQAVRSLHDSEKRFRAAFEQAAVGIAHVGTDGRWLRVNQKLCDIVGYTRGELLSLTFQDITHAEDLDTDLAQMNQVLEGAIDTYTLEKRYLRKDGSTIWINLTVALVHDEAGKPDYFISVVEDIQRRKCVEEELLRTTDELAFFATLVKSSDEAIASKNLDGIVTTWNAGAERIYGYTAAEMLGQPMTRLYPEDRLHEEQRILGRIRAGDRFELETVRRRKDGRLIDMSIVESPIRDKRDTIIGAANFGRDITERKRAEERFRLAVEAAPSAMIMVNRSGQIVFVNSQGEKLFGYARGELIGQSIDMLVPERFRSPHAGYRNAFFGDLKSRPMGTGRHLFGLRRNGSEVPVEIGLNPIETAEGTLVLVAIVDITERRRLEERFRATVESAPTAMVMVDQAGSIVLVNAFTETLFGYQREELLGCSVEILLPARYRAAHPGLREGFFRVPSSRRMGEGRDLYGQRKDGSEFPVEIGLNPIEMPEGVFVLGAIVDITERKRLEERFRATVESAPTAMVMIDQTGSIVLVNALTETLFGYRRAELLGRSIETLLPERYRAAHPALREGFFHVPSSRRMGEGRELYGQRKDGSEFPVEIGLNPIVTSEGTFVLSVIVDITERARAAAELQRRTDELARSNRDLEQFAYVASHDLQEPLRAVAGSIRLLQRRYQGQLDARADEYIGHAVDGAIRMEALIDDLLTYSRVGRQEDLMRLTQCDEALEHALQNLRMAIQESGAQVTHTALPVVRGVSAQLSLLFQNLVGNAIKFRRKDGPVNIQMGAEAQGDEWRFSVADNGIGIEPQYFERIFMIFQRLHTRAQASAWRYASGLSNTTAAASG